MKCKTHQIHLVVLALLMCLPGVYSSKVLADAPMVACDLENFTVEAETTAEAQAVCKLVSDALPQLQDCHMPVKLPVKIIVSDEMRGVGPRCLGYYQCESSEIYVRSAEGMAQSIDPEGAYSQIETDVFFESIVVHELAHALFQQNACVSAVCADNHEYVGHAMQMVWLPEDARAQIVQEYAQEPPIDPMLLNGFIAAMAPDRYAALVWQHFSEPENGCNFVQRLLIGETTLQFPPN